MKNLLLIGLLICLFSGVKAQVKDYEVTGVDLLGAENLFIWQGDTIKKDSIPYFENKGDSIRLKKINGSWSKWIRASDFQKVNRVPGKSLVLDTEIAKIHALHSDDQDLSGLVTKTTTVNGHALSGNVSVTKTDVGLTNVTDDAQVKRSEMGSNNGVATLDAGGKVPFAQLPSSLMIYKGVWSPLNNIPTLADGSGTTGWVYKASMDGTINLGSGAMSFYADDYVIYNGTRWEKSRGSDNVHSVNGQQGVVTLTTTNIAEGTNKYYTDARVSANSDVIHTNRTSLDLVSGTNTGDETTATIKSKLGITTLSGSNTGDQDLSGLVVKETGKGLSTNDYTTAEKSKLSGIEANANNYIHPSTHAPSIIAQDASNRFVSDTEKSTWNGKAPASGSANYVQVSPASAQSGNINITGSGTFGGNLFVNSTNASAFPATSGVTQNGLISRFQHTGSNATLDFGLNGGSGAWLQVTDITGLNNYYPLLLNPNGGNVGIGTTNPSLGKLQVNGTGYFSGNLFVNSTNASAFPSTSGTTQTGLISRFQHSDSNATLDFGLKGGNGAWLQVTDQTGLNNNYPLVLNPNGGNVGVGITNPVNTFNIAKGVGTTKSPSTITAANSYIHIGRGDYGGGATTNTGKYMIGFGYLGNVNINSPAYIGYEAVDEGGETKGDLTFYTRSVTTDTAPLERMRISNNGNVGIGYSAGAEITNNKLAVNGNIYASSATFTTGAGAGKVLTSDVSGNGSWSFIGANKITYSSANTFSSDRDIVDKAYVDAVATGNLPKLPVDVATTGNITLSGTQTIDTYSTVVGSRVLVWKQSTASQNGVYIVASGAWTRATDTDAWSELYKAYVAVLNGAQAGSSFVCTIPSSGTLGTTDVTWVLYNVPTNIIAGTGLSKTGNTLSSTITQYTDAMADARVVAGITGKQNTLTTGTSAQYLKGDLTLGTFPTALSSFTNDLGSPWQSEGYWSPTNHPTTTAGYGLPAYPTQYTDAMADTRVAAGITGKVNTTTTVNSKPLSSNIVLNPDDLDDTSTSHKFVASTDITNWNAKVSNATHTGDVTGSTALTLATVNSNIGTYNNVTVNGKGLVIGASNVSYLTGITSSNVTTALGYTPYNASNPNGYTSNTGTVTSVGMTVPMGLTVTGSPITTSGTLAIGLQSGYSIPTTTNQMNWTYASDNVFKVGLGYYSGGFKLSTQYFAANDGTFINPLFGDIIENGDLPVLGGKIYTELSTKQNTLVSGTNIKTVDNISILGSGNISTTKAWGSITGTLSNQTDLQTALNGKAALSGSLAQSFNVDILTIGANDGNSYHDWSVDNTAGVLNFRKYQTDIFFNSDATITASGFKTPSGTSTQLLRADGTVSALTKAQAESALGITPQASQTFNMTTQTNGKYSITASTYTITFTNVVEGRTGQLAVKYNNATAPNSTTITLVAPSNYTLVIKPAIQNGATNAYTKTLKAATLGEEWVYSYYISGTDIYITGQKFK